MNIVPIIQDESASMVFYPDKGIVHHTFRKPISGQAFRHILLTGIEALQKYNGNKWLSDDRGNAALPDDDTEWSKTVWFPQALKAGWKFWALVVPEDIMARINLKEFVDSYYDQGLRIMVFTDPEQALKWLENL